MNFRRLSKAERPFSLAWSKALNGRLFVVKVTELCPLSAARESVKLVWNCRPFVRRRFACRTRALYLEKTLLRISVIWAKFEFGLAPRNRGTRQTWPSNGPPTMFQAADEVGGFRFVSTKFGSEFPKLPR